MNGSVNNREAGDFRRHLAQYGVIVINQLQDDSLFVQASAISRCSGTLFTDLINFNPSKDN